MQSHPVHHLVHDEGRAGHIARVLHEGDEEVEDDDVGQEDDHASHAADDAIHDQVLERSLRHVASEEVSQLCHQPFDPPHGVAAQTEGGLEHHPEEEEEERESKIFVCDQGVNQLRAIGDEGLLTECLFQSSRNKTVAGVGEGRFGILAQQLLNVESFFVPACEDCAVVRQSAQALLHLFVTFQQFDAEIALRHVPLVCRAALHLPLHHGDRFLQHPSVRYQHMCMFFLLINGDHPLQQLGDPFSSFPHGGNDRGVDEVGESPVIEGAPALLQLIVHVQGDHYRHLQVDQLGGEVEVPFQGGGRYHVDDDVGLLLQDMLPHEQLFRGVCREGVGSRQIDQREGVSVVLQRPLFRVDRHAAVVAHMLMRP